MVSHPYEQTYIIQRFFLRNFSNTNWSDNGFSPVWTDMYHLFSRNSQVWFRGSALEILASQTDQIVTHQYELHVSFRGSGTEILETQTDQINDFLPVWTHVAFRVSVSEILVSQTDQSNGSAPVWTRMYYSEVLTQKYK